MPIKISDIGLTFLNNDATKQKIEGVLKDSAGTELSSRYPLNLGSDGQKAFMTFTVKDSVKLNGVEAEPEDAVALYLPPTLKVGYGAQYEEINDIVAQASALGLGGVESLKGSLKQLISMSLPSNSAFMSNINDSIQTLANAISGISGSNAALQAGIRTGQLLNPHMAVAFTGVEFRNFQFSFQMMARNEAESAAITKIIKFFKKNMHPSIKDAATNRWLLYPKNFDIKLAAPTEGSLHMFEIKTCALTSMNVDYAGSGTPSFFRGSGAPVDIRMDLNFKELVWLTREDFEDGKNY